MTREETKELLPIMQAFVEGKTIQIYDDEGEKWIDTTIEDLCFNIIPSYYRIKPEQKYRPFKSAEECLQEMQKHQPFGWIKSKKYNDYTTIVSVYTRGESKALIEVSPRLGFTGEQAYFQFLFIDGTPFGIKEE